jgi:hypothetical protein
MTHVRRNTGSRPAFRRAERNTVIPPTDLPECFVTADHVPPIRGKILS